MDKFTLISTLLSNINIWGILLASVVYFALGALWYSPILFSKPWIKDSGVKMGENRNMPLMFGLTFIGIVVIVTTMVIFSLLIIAFSYEFAVSSGADWKADGIGLIDKVGMAAGFGIGFIFPATAINNLYQGKPFRLTLIDAGYHIVGLAASGLIISLLGIVTGKFAELY